MKTTVELTRVVLSRKKEQAANYHKGEPRKWFDDFLDELGVTDERERLRLFQFRWMCELTETLQLNFDEVATSEDPKFALPACVIVRNKLVELLHHMDAKILPHAEPVTLVKAPIQ